MATNEEAALPQQNDTVKPTATQEFRRGFVDTMPLWLGVAPFGVAYALAARAGGLDVAQTMAMSLLVFAGASQFTAAGLFKAGVDGLTIVITTLIVNLRHILMTTSLAPGLRHLSWWQRAGLAFQVTDETYAVTVRRISQRESGPALLFGSNISLYSIWQASTVVGLLLGGAIPDPAALGLNLVFPLSFTVLLLPYLKSRPAVAAAAVSGIVALAGHILLEGRWYILIGAAAGCMVGAYMEARIELGTEEQQ